jgi:hypothetical protein
MTGTILEGSLISFTSRRLLGDDSALWAQRFESFGRDVGDPPPPWGRAPEQPAWRPSTAPQPAKVKLGTFDTVTLKQVEIAPEFAAAGANKKAAKKIDERLSMEMRKVFDGLQEAGGTPTQQGLLIEPLIEEIKFIGGAARFWVGAMAGSSAVLMKVTFSDAATGEIVAAPEFYRSADAYAGGMTMGAADNRMLEAIASDAATYAGNNRDSTDEGLSSPVERSAGAGDPYLDECPGFEGLGCDVGESTRFAHFALGFDVRPRHRTWIRPLFAPIPPLRLTDKLLQKGEGLMGKALGLILMLIALYIGMSIYTQGIDQALGGALAPLQPVGNRETPLATHLTPAAQLAEPPTERENRVWITDAVREQVSADVKAGARRRER